MIDFQPVGRSTDGRFTKTQPPEVASVDDGCVAVRVLPLGDGKISDGTFGPSPDRFGHYRRGDEPRLPRGIAQQLEGKGWVEIVPVS